MEYVSIGNCPHCVGSLERINPLTFAFIRNDPLLPATEGICVLQTHQETRPRPHFSADDCGLIRNSPRVRMCVCVTGARGSEFFPLTAVPYGMENHFYHIR